MGRPSNAEIAARNSGESLEIPAITYIPQNDGDPSNTLWNRHRFRANVPVIVKDVTGGLTAKEMVELAKGNPHFSVEGFDKAKGIPSVPETPEQYRMYAIGWIRTSVSTREMAARWRSEDDLRAQCGCADDDVEYIQSIYRPRLAIMKETEALAQSAVNE